MIIPNLKLYFENIELKRKIALMRIKRKKEIKKYRPIFKKIKENLIIKKLKFELNNKKKEFKKLKDTLNKEHIDFMTKDFNLKIEKKNWFMKLFTIRNPFFYIFKGEINGDWVIYKAFKPLNYFQSKYNELFLMHKPIGYYKGKPIYQCIKESILSIELIEIKEIIIDETSKKEIIRHDYKFLWNPTIYYNLVNNHIKKKLTEGESKNILDMLKQNWLMIIGVILVLLFLASPYGQTFIKNLMVDWGLNNG